MLPTISCSSRGNQLISTTLSLAFNRRLALNFVRFSFNQRKYSVFGSQGPGKFRQLPKDATVLYQLSYSAWAWLIATESVRSSEISISRESVSLITATIRQKLLLLIIKSNALSLSFTLPSPLSLIHSPLSSLSPLCLSPHCLFPLCLYPSLSHTYTHTHTHALSKICHWRTTVFGMSNKTEKSFCPSFIECFRSWKRNSFWSKTF